MDELIGAVDVGATKTMVTVRRLPVAPWLPGTTVSTVSTPRDPGTCADVVANSLKQLAAKQPGTLVAAGIASCGILGPPRVRASGVVVRSPNQGWEAVPLGPMLEERLGVPICLEDDANSGALGEAVLGAGRGSNPCVFVALGTGLGTGIVINEQVFVGAHGSAGELGHIVVDPEGPECRCGHRGCVEAFAAGAGLASRVADALPRVSFPIGLSASAIPAALFEAAEHGQQDARHIVDRGVEALARLFATIASAYDPELIVVGGGLGLKQPPYVTEAVARARAYCLEELGSTMRVVAAALGNESALAGAAVLAARSLGPRPRRVGPNPCTP
jgi:glucokinase